MPELSELFPATCMMVRLVPGDVIMNNDAPHRVMSTRMEYFHAEGGHGESGPCHSAKVRIQVSPLSDKDTMYAFRGNPDEQVEMVTYSRAHKKQTLALLEAEIAREGKPELEVVDVRFTFTRSDEDGRLDLEKVEMYGKSKGVTDSDLRTLSDSMGQNDHWQVILSRMGEVISGDTITG